ncbi:MAG: MopE-related protein, partial [Myxococcota bacterium]
MRRLILFACLAAIVGTGCPQPSNPCARNADCEENQSCIQGRCTLATARCTAGQTRPCYTGSDETRGKGICRDGQERCTETGTWSGRCDGEITPQPEQCNEKDNNCDGRKDNVAPTPEVCDGVDNDCDGRTDEDTQTRKPLARSCYTGKAGTRDQGPCRGGTQTCQQGQWSACVGQIVPKTELCANQVDDDCDGQVDNIPDLGQPCIDRKKQGQCQKGIYACAANQPRRCESTGPKTQEVCNGKDDDCDGRVDNVPQSQTLLARRCPTYDGPKGTENVGVCSAGDQLCEGGTWGKCVRQVKPSPELCNNKDDDCDGKIDNIKGSAQALSRSCYEGPEGTSGQGLCRGGTQSCTQGQWGSCKGQVLPKRELCTNQQDEDCDGIVDNVPFLGERCLENSRIGACRGGVFECNGLQRTCRQTVFSKPEECNGIDDDCDGKVDNIKGQTA